MQMKLASSERDRSDGRLDSKIGGKKNEALTSVEIAPLPGNG